MSMAAVIAYRPDRHRAVMVFQTIPGSYDSDTLIGFLAGLHRHLHGQVILIWDRLPAHRSAALRAWLDRQRHWLTTELLPAYAYDLNPCETAWGNLKSVELANLCPDTIDEATTAAENGLSRIGSNYQLCYRFLDHTRLHL
jgi:putative transposase